MSWRIASTAAPSPPFLSPRPTHRPAAIAAASVTRTSSIARLRSGASRRRSTRRGPVPGRGHLAVPPCSMADLAVPAFSPPPGLPADPPRRTRPTVPMEWTGHVLTRDERSGAPRCHDGGGEPRPGPGQPPRCGPGRTPGTGVPGRAIAAASRPCSAATGQAAAVGDDRAGHGRRGGRAGRRGAGARRGRPRSCSFAPGGPTVDPAGGPVVDAPAALRELRVPFPLRIPAVPAGLAVELGRPGPGGGRSGGPRRATSRRTARYLRLLQSDATEPVVLAVETGRTPAAVRGPVDVGGQRVGGLQPAGARADLDRRRADARRRVGPHADHRKRHRGRGAHRWRVPRWPGNCCRARALL